MSQWKLQQHSSRSEESRLRCSPRRNLSIGCRPSTGFTVWSTASRLSRGTSNQKDHVRGIPLSLICGLRRHAYFLNGVHLIEFVRHNLMLLPWGGSMYRIKSRVSTVRPSQPTRMHPQKRLILTGLFVMSRCDPCLALHQRETGSRLHLIRRKNLGRQQSGWMTLCLRMWQKRVLFVNRDL